jgi:hypothetical protein
MGVVMAQGFRWVAICAAVLLSGCSAIDLRSRGADLGDALRLRLGAGIGLYGEIEATSWIHPAIGFADASLTPRYTLGWDPRPGQPAGMLRTAAFPTLLVASSFYTEPWGPSGSSDIPAPLRGFLGACILMGNHYVEGESCSLLRLHEQIPNPVLSPVPSLTKLTASERSSRNSWLAISGTMGIVTFDVGINPLELLDAVLGCFSIDLLEDDEPTGVHLPDDGPRETAERNLDV